MTVPTVEERFWSKVDKSGDCWLWTAAIILNGYGRFHIHHGEPVYAHRYSYELAYGPIPEGMHVDHTCYSRACVNPAHLRAVTPKQNIENRSGLNKNSTSGVRGVYKKSGANRWVGQVRHERQFYYCGSHATKEAAEAAVLAKRLELFTHNDVDRRSH